MASRYRQYLDAKSGLFKAFVIFLALYLFGFGVCLVQYHLRIRSLSAEYDCDFISGLLLLREISAGLLLATPFVAAYAIYQDSRTFYVLLTLIFAAGFVVQLLYHNKSQVEQEQIVQHLIKVDLIAKFEQLSSDDRKAIEDIQQKENCCGVFKWPDFGEEKNVPSSCCHKYNGTQMLAACTTNELDGVKGCKDKFNENYRGRYFYYQAYQSALFVLISVQMWIILFSVALVLYGGGKEETPLPSYNDAVIIVALGVPN